MSAHQALVSENQEKAISPIPPEVRDVLTQSLTDTYAGIFKVLGEGIRMDILFLIGSNGQEEYPCTLLEKNLSVAKSTISYHVKLLHQARLVNVRREGREFRYTVNWPLLEYFVPDFFERCSSERAELLGLS